MKREKLVKNLSLQMGVTKKKAELYFNAFLDSIMETLYVDGHISINGFGSFKINKYKARIAKKPLTGEHIQLPVRQKISFHPGKELRERVNTENLIAKETETFINQIQDSKNVQSIAAG